MNGFSHDLLAGKNILITGASSGIGRATAKYVAMSGGRVLASGRNEERLGSLLAELSGTQHVAVPFALEGADQVAEWCKSVSAKEGGLDGIFHSAGIELIRPVRLIKEAQLQAVLGSSLYAGFGLARAAASKGVMRESGGALVFMSSVAGLRGQAGMTGYSAAKAAIDGMVRSLALELAERRVRVNSIAAGAVRTEMHSRLNNSLGPQAAADYEARHPLGFGETDDIAAAAIYLLSSLGKWITGATWVVDGGYTLR